MHAGVCRERDSFYSIILQAYKAGLTSKRHPRCVLYTGVLTSAYRFATQSLQGVYVCSCIRSLFIRVGGQGWGGSASLCRALVAWSGGLFSTEGEIDV